MTTEMGMEIEPLSPILGARVHGVDLTEPDSVARTSILREAFSKYCVLCFPQQTISNDDQIRFARNFGRADADIISKTTADDTPEYLGQAKRGVIYISNLRENGQQVGSLPDGELHFHSDGAHRASPYRATTLYAIEIPTVGGETKFANMQMAYDHLPEAMKQRLEGLIVNNVYDIRASLREQTDVTDEKMANAQHALVRVHPDSGRKSLYLSRLMTRSIVGLDRAESDALLDELFAHVERPEFIYAHSWKVADLLTWDNRAVNHARADFPASQRRHLRRVTVSEP